MLWAGAALCAAAGAFGQTLVQTIVEPPGNAGAQFGITIRTDGDAALIIGGDDLAAIYERDATTGLLERRARLRPADPTASLFGYGLFGADVEGDVALVGMHHYTPVAGPSSSGGIYVFERDAGGPGAWGETTLLRPSDPWNLGYFGLSAVIDGGVIVGAAPQAFADPLDPESRQGAVYVFERESGGGWHETARISAPNGQGGDGFGYGLDIDGDRIAVGAPYREGPGGEAGMVFLFERSAERAGEWVLIDTLLPTTEDANQFGLRVRLRGDTLVTTDNDGRIEIFRNDEATGWVSVLQRQTFGSFHGVDADARRVLLPSLGRIDRPWGAEFRADTDDPDTFAARAVFFGPSFPRGYLVSGALMGDYALVAFDPFDHDRDDEVFVYRIDRFADFETDGVIDGADLSALLDAWGSPRAGIDLDGDGVVTGADLGLLLGAWGPAD